MSELGRLTAVVIQPDHKGNYKVMVDIQTEDGCRNYYETMGIVAKEYCGEFATVLETGKETVVE